MSYVDDLTYRLNMGLITEREFNRQYDDAQYEDYMDRLDEAQREREYQEYMEKQYEEYCQEEYKKYVKSLAATKGRHTHNHQRNALERKLNRSKESRKRCHNVLNKGYEYKFVLNRGNLVRVK